MTSTAAVVLAASVLLLVMLSLLDRARRLQRTSAAALAASDQQLRVLADAVPVGVLLTDPEGSPRYANPCFAGVVGRGPLPEPIALAFAASRTGPHTGSEPVVLTGTDGSVRRLNVSCRPLLDGERVTGWVGLIEDATEQADLGRRLERLTEIFEATPDIIAVVDADGRGQWVNTAGRIAFHLGPDDLTHRRGLEAYTPESREVIIREALPAAARDGVWRGEVSLALPAGRELLVSQVLVAHRTADGGIDRYSSISRDLSERRSYESRLLHAALHDALTGLPNRTLFADRCAQALARANRTEDQVAVLSVDLDEFKLVNDSLGHEAGDELLVATAHRLADAARSGDTVARFEGDTFTVLCEDLADEQAAVAAAQRLAAALVDPFEVHGDQVFVTVSTGIALTGDGPASPESLVRDAEAAMHRAKEKGRSRHELFVEDLHATAVHRLRTANDLRRALTDEEFDLVYQPEIALDTGHIAGVEALVRWHHPERGMVPPAEFVALAEQTGIITGIGAWALDTAVAQAARWRTARFDGGPLTVWVNLSARQLEDPRLVTTVDEILTRHGVSPAQIGLEITESGLFADAELAVQALAALHALGVRLAVDDFGTGYSSLSYLKKLPVDTVKVDRSFIGGLDAPGDDTAIVAAVMGMARALRLSVIAEGVENRAHLRALRELGCDYAQGFYFAVPQPAEHLSRLLEADRVAALFAFEDAVPPTPLLALAPHSPN